jgi:hypothetical protein
MAVPKPHWPSGMELRSARSRSGPSRPRTGVARCASQRLTTVNQAAQERLICQPRGTGQPVMIRPLGTRPALASCTSLPEPRR